MQTKLGTVLLDLEYRCVQRSLVYFNNFPIKMGSLVKENAALVIASVDCVGGLGGVGAYCGRSAGVK